MTQAGIEPGHPGHGRHSISTPYELSNVKIGFISKCLITIVTIFSMIHWILKILSFYSSIIICFDFFVKWHINLHGLFNNKTILVEEQH